MGDPPITDAREVPQAPAPVLLCESWEPYCKGTLQGFADLVMPKAGIRLLRCMLHERNGQAWVSPQAREVRNQDGERVGWSSVLEWVSHDARRAWSDAAVAAIRDYRQRHGEPAARAGGYEW